MLNIIDIPNGSHGRRRSDAEIDLVVLHAIGEWVVDYTNAGGKGQNYTWHCTDWLRAIGRSCHAFCMPDGRLVREVDSAYKAWHCKGSNSRSVGIEFVLPGVWPYGKFQAAMQGKRDAAYTDAQIRAGAEWVSDRMIEHEIELSIGGNSEAVIRSHSVIAPGLKFDPGVPFPIASFRTVVEQRVMKALGGP